MNPGDILASVKDKKFKGKKIKPQKDDKKKQKQKDADGLDSEFTAILTGDSNNDEEYVPKYNWDPKLTTEDYENENFSGLLQ